MNSWPGDWNCRSCNHLNFQRRDTCQRCGELRPGGGGGGGGDNLFASFGGAGGRSGGGGGGGFFSSGPDVRPGDWYCTVGNCGAHNFASRSSCFKCGSYKEDYSSSTGSGGGIGGGGLFYDGLDVSSAYGTTGRRSAGFGFGGSSTGGGSSRSGWKSGDWICTRFGCNEHNFASRMECFKCSAPRDSNSTGPPYYT